jgi:hypothetical protein
MAITITINTVSVKTPSDLQRVDIKPISKKRGLKNGLKTDILDYDKKAIFDLYYGIINTTQYQVWKTYVDTGEVAVVITDTAGNESFTGTCIVSDEGYKASYAGYKKGYKIRLEQV